MRTLPSGTVTFLFTDVESSTKLLHELGDTYAEALAHHRRLMREVFARHGGVEVDTQGDAFFVAFASASDALAAASAAQEAFAGGPMRVRMGLHTGKPQLTEEGYAGLDVHRAARIAAAGHGGQVLLSEATLKLVDGEVLDLGEHRLKDFPDPVWIFQLGSERFAPLKTISNTNLPRPASSFVGRRRELEQVVSLLQNGARLVTLAGPGGSGKTRLAIEAAVELVPEFRAGVFWVGLAAINDPRLVMETVAQTLGAENELASHIGERELLLLLDNFEQVIEAARDVSALLESCPNLRLLVTSRELLRVRGEVVHEVPPLADTEAIELFCARARVDATEDVAELCRRLDNLPLAVELAAARVRVLSPRHILDRLSQRLDLLKGGRDTDPRQQTLRSTIAWSHELLSDEEQCLFPRLAIFAGGCSLQAGEAVAEADLDTLQALVDKSLIRVDAERYWMLETIREYALERLEELGQSGGLRRQHAEYFLALAESANLSEDSPGESRPEIISRERANIRAALGWARERGETELGLRLAVSLEGFWNVTDPVDGMRWLEAFMKRAAEVPARLRAAALRVYGGAAAQAGEGELAERLHAESLSEYRQLGDDLGAAIVLVRVAHDTWYRGDVATAVDLGREALDVSRRLGNHKSEAQALGLLGDLEFERGGASDVGLDLLQASAAKAAACGFQWWQGRMLVRLVKRARELGRDGDASRWALESLRLAASISDRRRLVSALDLVAAIAADHGQLERAGRLTGAVEAEVQRDPIPAWSASDLPASVVTDPAFDRARRAGRRLTLEEAIEYALEASRVAPA